MKTIIPPKLTSATRLTPLELNHIHFSNKRTVLTPAQLERIASASKTANQDASSSGDEASDAEYQKDADKGLNDKTIYFF